MMAEELDDGEFWLPSEILTDDDILMDLDLPSSASLTASSESDDDDLSLSGLTHHLTLSLTVSDSSALPSKGVVLSSSPQSTLCGFAGNQGSSRGSPVGAVSPPPAAVKDDGATWDLLYKAAGEVARIKMRSESGTKVGTGFFDCSAQRPFCPPPPINNTAAAAYPSLHLPPHFPPLSHLRQQQQMMIGMQFNRVTTRNDSFNNSAGNNNRPLGLPPSAWPPLQAQKQQSQPISPPGTAAFMGQPGPKRVSVGTGVFLPRRPAETRKKSETNGTKTRNGKGGLKSQNQQHQRNSRPPTSSNPKAVHLPQEWTY